MARANTVTLLSLDRYARIMGINPAHFNTGVAGNIMPMSAQCNDIFWQHSWQAGDRASREEIARAISDAEQEIATYLGYWPAPKYIAKEMHVYPHTYRPDWGGNGLDALGYYKSVQTKYGKFIAPGVRSVSPIGTATTAGGTLVYSDADGDGFDETATITLTTTITDPCGVKAFVAGYSGAPEWELRSPRSVTISGGVVTMVFYTWQLVDPDLWEAFPDSSDPLTAIDLTSIGNLLTSVEVYYEFANSTEESAQFFWEPTAAGLDPASCSTCGGGGCLVCSVTVQDGCIHVRNVDLGLVAPQVGQYNSSTANWESLSPAVCREPDLLKIWYYAGDIDNCFLAGQSCDPLSQFFAETIAWLATARLDYPLCGCGAVSNKSKMLQTDVVLVTGGNRYVNTFKRIDNPFGTRLGEVKAWKRLESFVRKVMPVAVI